MSFREQYRNMAEKIRPDHIHLVENAVKAAEEVRREAAPPTR